MRDCMFFFLHQFEGQHQPLGLVSCWASEEAGILRLDQLGTHEFQDVSRCFMVVLWSRRRGYRSVHEPTAHLISWLFFLCTDSFVDFLGWHYPLISPIVHTVGPSPAAPYLCCVALDRCPMVPFHISFPGSMCFNGWISWEKSFLRSLEDLDDDMNADVPRKVASSASVVSEASVAATWQRWGPCRNESSHDMDPLAFHVLVRKKQYNDM